MTLFSVSTSQSLPGLVRRHLSPHLKFSPCPRWCASSNKEFLLLCQPLPLLLCRSNSPSSSERYRPYRRRGHHDPGSPKKSRGCRFFLRPVVVEKKLILVSLCHRPCGRTWHSYSGDEKFDKVWTGHIWARLPSQLPSYTENPEAAFEGQCIFLLHWIGHHILPSCWDPYSEIFLKTFVILWR